MIPAFELLTFKEMTQWGHSCLHVIWSTPNLESPWQHIDMPWYSKYVHKRSSLTLIVACTINHIFLHWSPADSSKGQYYGALMFAALSAWRSCYQTVNLPLIWDALMVMWHHCDTGWSIHCIYIYDATYVNHCTEIYIATCMSSIMIALSSAIIMQSNIRYFIQHCTDWSRI